MIASIGASVGEWALFVALAPIGLAVLLVAVACLRYDGGRPASRELNSRFDRELGDVLADAVERAELRRRGVVPLERPNPQRRQLEDDLLRIVDRARGGAA